MKLLENEIYKGDFVHGKRTEHYGGQRLRCEGCYCGASYLRTAHRLSGAEKPLRCEPVCPPQRTERGFAPFLPHRRNPPPYSPLPRAGRLPACAWAAQRGRLPAERVWLIAQNPTARWGFMHY